MTLFYCIACSEPLESENSPLLEGTELKCTSCGTEYIIRRMGSHIHIEFKDPNKEKEY